MLADFLMLLLGALAAGGLGFVMGREVGIAEGWRQCRETFRGDDTDEAGA